MIHCSQLHVVNSYIYTYIYIYVYIYISMYMGWNSRLHCNALMHKWLHYSARMGKLIRTLHGGEDTSDALSLQGIFRKRALWLVSLLQKITCNLRHPMGLRHPVQGDLLHAWVNDYTTLHYSSRISKWILASARRGGALGSRPKKMYGERLGDGVEYHLMSPTPRR